MDDGMMIRLVDRDPRWPQLFQQERLRIAVALGQLAASFEHIGSTAMPEVARSKPIIDILVGLRDEQATKAAVAKMQGLGYAPMSTPVPEGRTPMKRGTPRSHHAHLVVFDGDEWRRHVMFRDWLSLHPNLAREYTALKVRLAEQFAEDRAAYTEGKTVFVEAVLMKAQQFPARRLVRI